MIDIETTGLDPKSEVILEIACVLLDDRLREVGHYSSVINDDGVFRRMNELRRAASYDPTTGLGGLEFAEDQVRNAQFIWHMHTESGLWADIATATHVVSAADVEDELESFLRDYGMRNGYMDEDKGQQVILTGSSIHFDVDFLNAQMPSIPNYFFHRRLDVSGFKVAVDTWREDLRTQRMADLTAEARHRALPDCRDSIHELKWYLNNVLDVML